MTIEQRGPLTSSRKPGLDPKVGYELSKIIRSIPSITNGTEFPSSLVRFGDMHFYTGPDTIDFKSNNWYIKTTLSEPANGWQSMNATALNPANIQTGTIPTGVKISDYMPLTGGVFAGVLTFAQSQTFPAESIAPGTLPPGVLVSGALALAGGAMLGSINMTNHNINSIAKLYGYDNDLLIDVSHDGLIAVSADDTITIQATTLTIAGTIALSSLNVDSGVLYVDITNNRVGINDTSPDFDLDLNGNIRLQTGKVLYFGGTGAADNDVNLYRSAADILKTDDTFQAANVDQDVRSGAAPVFSAANFTNYNIVCTDDDVVVANGEVVYA